MPEMRAMTLRFPQEQAEQLDLVAMVDEQPIVEVVRAAITAYVSRRTQDPAFQAKLRQKIEMAQDMLTAGSGGPDA